MYIHPLGLGSGGTGLKVEDIWPEVGLQGRGAGFLFFFEVQSQLVDARLLAIRDGGQSLPRNTLGKSHCQF